MHSWLWEQFWRTGGATAAIWPGSAQQYCLPFFVNTATQPIWCVPQVSSLRAHWKKNSGPASTHTSQCTKSDLQSIETLSVFLTQRLLPHPVQTASLEVKGKNWQAVLWESGPLWSLWSPSSWPDNCIPHSVRCAEQPRQTLVHFHTGCQLFQEFHTPTYTDFSHRSCKQPTLNVHMLMMSNPMFWYHHAPFFFFFFRNVHTN